jgi:hypothetical protein
MINDIYNYYYIIMNYNIIETPFDYTWLIGDYGKKWLNTYNGNKWLQTKDGNDWLETYDGQIWLFSKNKKSNERKQNKVVSFLDDQIENNSIYQQTKHTYNSNCPDFKDNTAITNWLKSENNLEWIINENIGWKESKKFQEWLFTDDGCKFFDSFYGEMFMFSPHGIKFLMSDLGQEYLIITNFSLLFLHKYNNWLLSDDGMTLLKSDFSKDFIECYKKFKNSNEYKIWIGTNDGVQWAKNYMDEFISINCPHYIIDKTIDELIEESNNSFINDLIEQSNNINVQSVNQSNNIENKDLNENENKNTLPKKKKIEKKNILKKERKYKTYISIKKLNDKSISNSDSDFTDDDNIIQIKQKMYY